MSRAKAAAQYSGTALYGLQATITASQAPGLIVSSGLGDQLLGLVQSALNLAAGVLNVLTAGLSTRFLNFTGLSSLIDTTSTAYRVGQYVGQVIQIVLTVFPPAGVIALGLMAVQVAGGVFNVMDAIEAGNTEAIVLGIVNIAMTVAHFVPVCQTAAVSGVLGAVQSGLLTYSATMNVAAAFQSFANGDFVEGLLQLGQAAADVYAANQACFPRGFYRLANGGFTAWEDSHEKDPIDTCNETNPRGRIVTGHIQQMHVAWANIWHLEANGKTLRTTALHPFFVWGKGWVRCWQLEPGDELRSHNGVRVFVERVYDSGVVEKVYGCTVDEHHTYFVGKPDWGFTIWAHNGCTPEQLAENRKNGLASEDEVLAKLQANPNIEVVGTKIRVKTPGAGEFREIDILIRNKRTGQLSAIEVKSGSGVRDASQIAKDGLMATGGSAAAPTTFFGRNARGALDVPNGTPTGNIPTYVARLP